MHLALRQKARLRAPDGEGVVTTEMIGTDCLRKMLLGYDKAMGRVIA